MERKILRPGNAAEFLNVARTTLWRLSKEKGFPAKIQIGVRAVGWRQSDLEKWLESREVSQ